MALDLYFDLMRFWRGDAALVAEVTLDELAVWVEQTARLARRERPDDG